MKLTVEGLSKRFKRKSMLGLSASHSVQAVDNVSFVIPAGGALGLVGESGSGKTTVLKILAGFESADRGTVFWGEQSLLGCAASKRARVVQMVFQDPFASLNPKLILGAQLDEALRVASTADIFTRRSETMREVGLPEQFLSRYPHQLSGGQRQRFALARALAARPAVLLADEPVSSLDIAVQAQVINLLNDLRRKHGFALLLISHDVAVVVNTCERMIVMNAGQVVEEGEVEAIIAAPIHPYTQRLLSSVPRLETQRI